MQNTPQKKVLLIIEGGLALSHSELQKIKPEIINNNLEKERIQKNFSVPLIAFINKKLGGI